MRRLDYTKISNIAEDIMDLADGLDRGDWGPNCATRDELLGEFVNLALELDYVVKRVPRNEARCPYTIEMAIDDKRTEGVAVMQIDIIRLSDTYDCETCGSSWASGARVLFDGNLAFELEPVAHCYDGANYEDDEIFKRVLAHLGHDLVISGEE